MNLNSFLISLQLSLITTLILAIIGFPISYYLAKSKNIIKHLIKSLFNLPLILPPTVLGFYLLIFLSKRSFIDKTAEDVFKLNLTFSFLGIIIASIVFSMPFMIQHLVNGFENIDKSLIEASYTPGKSKIFIFFRITIPKIY